MWTTLIDQVMERAKVLRQAGVTRVRIEVLGGALELDLGTPELGSSGGTKLQRADPGKVYTEAQIGDLLRDQAAGRTVIPADPPQPSRAAVEVPSDPEAETPEQEVGDALDTAHLT